MQVGVNGTRLWFDVDGPALVPAGDTMRQRPTLVLVHGGPGTYDHSYFKPAFGALTEHAQVVYLDLRGHGRSEWGDPADWSFEACGDDIRAFCDVLGIARPVVVGHSMGAPVVLLYGARHPGHAAGLVVVAGFARDAVPRLVHGIADAAGEDVAALARRRFAGEQLTVDEWSRVFDVYGPNVPGDAELRRRRQNLGLSARGLQLLRELDVVAELRRVASPTLVCVGELDPVTPPAAAREIADALPDGLARLEILPGAGHFPWKDVPERFWPLLVEFAYSQPAAAPSRSSP